MAAQPPVHHIHVEGRTPGPKGKADMVPMSGGAPKPVGYPGSHHEAVYLAAIMEMADAQQRGIEHVVMTSPSEHLVEQMNGRWEVGPELRSFHEVASIIAARFADITWNLAPRTP